MWTYVSFLRVCDHMTYFQRCTESRDATSCRNLRPHFVSLMTENSCKLNISANLYMKKTHGDCLKFLLDVTFGVKIVTSE